jgi:hypothetical protein
MSKKLQNNGLWESSRMMLPEHKEAILDNNRTILKKRKPLIDFEEQESFTRLLAFSLWEKQKVTIVLYGEFHDQEYTGVATKIDQQKRMIRMESTEDYTWIHFDDIVKIECPVD